jgi:hypothetical protein
LNKIKRKKKYYAWLHILETLSENKYFLFLKINFISTKDKKNINESKYFFQKLNEYSTIKKKSLSKKG